MSSPEPRVVDRLASLTGDVATTAITLVELLAGAPISTADAQIAAICLVHGGICATGNVKGFAYTGVELIASLAGRSSSARSPRRSSCGRTVTSTCADALGGRLLQMALSVPKLGRVIERVHDDREAVQLLLSDAAMDLVWFRGQMVVTGPMRRPG